MRAAPAVWTPEWQAEDAVMARDWSVLSNDAQLMLAHEALLRAGELLASQAECLAGEMESGTLHDRGGPDALRLFAALIRVHGSGDAAAGNA
eukprot:gene11661-biopygen9805